MRAWQKRVALSAILAAVSIFGLIGLAGRLAAQTATPSPTPNPLGQTLVTPIPPATATLTPTLGATFTFSPFTTATLPPPITIDPRAFPTTSPCPIPQPFRPGDRVALTPGVNVRSAPSLSGALVNYYIQDTALTILEGPICANGYNWWRVSGEAYSNFVNGDETPVGTGEPGWVIEGSNGRLFLRLISTVDPSQICFPPLNIRTGDTILTITGVRAHEQPDLDSLVREVAPSDTRLTVLEGPVCADRLNWYRVAVPLIGGGSVEGWIAEGFPGDYYIIEIGAGGGAIATTSPCYPPLLIGAGTRAAILRRNNIPVPLRAAPGENAAVVASLINGVAFDVTGSPVCADGFNFWPVRVVGGASPTGWLAEGLPGAYWWDILLEVGPRTD